MRKNEHTKTFPELVAEYKGFKAHRDFEALVRTHGVSLPLLQAVVTQRLLPKDEACRLWGDSLGVAYVDPFVSIVTDDAVQAIPQEIAKKANVMGLYVVDGVLTVAMSRPTDAELVKRLSQIVQMPVSPVFSFQTDIADAVQIHYSNEKNLEDCLSELEANSAFAQGELSTDRLAALADSESMIKVLDEVIYFALRERATDIHIEAHETVSRIRFRIDGRLR
ncbi:MAG TPA: type II/IV secretion system protein, partial [Candidatus Synoicihabitans sp.]|nr:type II/IV secretion system protein [Candidatus Synoicihabitans sp.]